MGSLEYTLRLPNPGWINGFRFMPLVTGGTTPKFAWEVKVEVELTR